MLPSSNFSITFNKSNDFLKCMTLIHLSAATLVLLSNFSGLCMALLLSLLMLSFLQAHRNPKPHPNVHQLSCHARCWRLDTLDGQQEEYNTAHINFEGGIFILLRLVNEHSKRIIVLFKDQLTPSQYHVLKVLSRIG